MGTLAPGDDDRRFDLDELLAEAAQDSAAEIAACRQLTIDDLRRIIEQHTYPTPALGVTSTDGPRHA
jgi:hypothetical protein